MAQRLTPGFHCREVIPCSTPPDHPDDPNYDLRMSPPDLTAGYAITGRIVSPELLAALHDATDTRIVGTGLRFVTRQLPAAHAAAHGVLLTLARTVLGERARPVRSILFDKTAASNWLVPWHQDLTIAVAARHDLPGYGPWSTKDATPHVQPPRHVLEAMITLRLHLDDTPADNGALRVIPGSHAHGILSAEQTAELRQSTPEVTCRAAGGDVLLMRPLLLHASSKSTRPNTRRRVLHIDYAATPLPAPLQWAE